MLLRLRSVPDDDDDDNDNTISTRRFTNTDSTPAATTNNYTTTNTNTTTNSTSVAAPSSVGADVTCFNHVTGVTSPFRQQPLADVDEGDLRLRVIWEEEKEEEIGRRRKEVERNMAESKHILVEDEAVEDKQVCVCVCVFVCVCVRACVQIIISLHQYVHINNYSILAVTSTRPAAGRS